MKIYAIAFLLLALTSSVHAANCGDKTCVAGEYCSAIATGTGTCTACGKGRYRATPDANTALPVEVLANVCTQCSAGKYNDQDKAASCSNCVAGKTSEAGSDDSADCTDCLEGTYGAGGTTCTQCKVGTYNDAKGKSLESDCKNCDAGYTSDLGTTAKANCKKCPVGQYGAGGTACSKCAAGKSSLEGSDAADDCKECEIGQFSAEGGPCQACAAGTSSSQKGSASCTACDGNFYSTIANSISTCHKSCDTSSAEDHTKCVKDHYCTKSGTAFTCTKCAEGTTRAQDSKSGCTGSASVIAVSFLVLAILSSILF